MRNGLCLYGAEGQMAPLGLCRTYSVANNAVVVVRQKQHGRQSNTTHLASRRSRQDRLLTNIKSNFRGIS